MSKNKQKAKGTKPEAAASTAPAVAAVQVKPVVLVVLKKDAKLRGARADWYKVLVEHDGKTADEFVAATKATPPSLPKSQKPENPNGWLGWFKRQGLVELKPGA